MTLKVIVQPGEDSGFVARDQALANIREAVAAWLETEQDKIESQSAPVDVEIITV
jgi:predicted RNase H-like HicB family nuclease